jgi:hypothetical protein
VEEDASGRVASGRVWSDLEGEWDVEARDFKGGRDTVDVEVEARGEDDKGVEVVLKRKDDSEDTGVEDGAGI